MLAKPAQLILRGGQLSTGWEEAWKQWVYRVCFTEERRGDAWHVSRGYITCGGAMDVSVDKERRCEIVNYELSSKSPEVPVENHQAARSQKSNMHASAIVCSLAESLLRGIATMRALSALACFGCSLTYVHYDIRPSL